MGKIKIVTDSTVDLRDEVLHKYEIEVVPLSIHIDGQTYIDREDITPEEFMVKMKYAEELPKSSQPPTGVFLELYDRLIDEGYEVISIHMTGGMSGTVQSAESAASMAKGKVTVIDSRYISRALAFQVIEAAKMAQAGKTVEEIVASVENIRENTRLFVYVDTLENLIKGGRIGKGKAMIGSILNIKPIASLEGGVYSPVAKVRSHTQAAKYLAKEFAEDVKGKTIKGVGLVHAEGVELAHKIKQAIFELTGYEVKDIDYTTPIVSTHTGPGAIGFMYYVE
ncbi:DegV family protein [Robertmurraya andreesenii]|uniref:DegV family protein with EDD domain n=1 Tax=Anoxybacillus andreesenii TaxID=1325932 RepID=A0ABT9V2C9_9BACL|nr:DegV family protein [Robertmurraya andreesenii]MDQ0155107.1 DegV family protein with EDD domain [Robertmurraya andreesenii]